MKVSRSPLSPAALLPLLSLLLVAALPAAGPAAAQAPEAPPAGATGEPTAGEPAARPTADPRAAYHFSVGKLLIDEGDYRGALASFERALEIDPAAAYVRIELSELLTRLGRFGRTRDGRAGRLREALRQAQMAREQLGGHVDALRAVAEAGLALAAEEPEDPSHLTTALAALEAVRADDPEDLRSLLSLGQIYLRQGDAAAAAAVFEDVVRSTPDYQPVYRLLAQALLESGQRDKARQALARVIEIEPTAESVRVTLSELHSEAGDHAAAAEVLRSAPPGTLESPEARTRLATELYLIGELDAALGTLDPLLAEQAGDRYLNLLRGLILSAQAKNAEALAALEPLLEGGPEDGRLAVTVSELFLREGREREAVETLERTAERLEGSGAGAEAGEVRLALARLYAERGRWREAERVAAPLAGAADEELARQAELLMADVLVEQGEGEAALERLAALGDATPAVRGKRVEVLARTGREAEAVALLEELAVGDDPEVFHRAVEGLHRAEGFAASVPALERFLEGHPDDLAGNFLLAAAFERSERTAEAATVFERLLERYPEFHPALNYLGYMWIDRGENLERAIELVERAVALDPDNGAYVDSLGWGYYRQGRLPEARQTLERAVRLTQDPTIYEHLGDVYAALGEPEEARRAYRRALDLDADDPEAVAQKLADLEAGTARDR